MKAKTVWNISNAQKNFDFSEQSIEPGRAILDDARLWFFNYLVEKDVLKIKYTL